MSNAPKAQSRVDQFFTGAEARHDRWRMLLQRSLQWESSIGIQKAEAKNHQSQVHQTLEELHQWEGYFAYPGLKLLATLDDRIASGDAIGTTRLARAISTAIVTHSYRTNIEDWENEEDSVGNLADRLPLSGEPKSGYLPYFEVLFVSPARQSMWKDLGQELGKLRRPQDRFVYESVFVGTFEDAILAVVLNGGFEAVVVYDDVPFALVHSNPVLWEFLTSYCSASGIDSESLQGLGLELPPNPSYDAYYGLIDFEYWANKNIGKESVEYSKKNVHPLDLAFRLAEDHGIVLLNGGGFDAPDWSLRVSLANLDDDVYEEIGRGVRSIARGYRDAYEAQKHAQEAKKPGKSATTAR
jgi:hypothetical protein